MNDAVRMRTICTGQAITMPGGGDVHLIATPPKPCVTIVVHGVNDLAGCYERIERGLCAGLNERLDMPSVLPNGMSNPGFLRSASYSLPEDDGGKASNPDAVYYRRKFSAAANGADTRSVVIPFYWGFREEEGKIIKDAPHGEWMDRNRNRLDKSGTKEGGQFANATTNLPDMWGEGFNGFPFGIIPLNMIGGQRSHPLFSAAGRRYMVLAAMRLAMLIKIIRKRYPNDTINVVGHSQGTLLNLLAHAFLKDETVRPADGVIMLNSPYSLYQPFNDKLQNWLGQQTTGARIATLNGILQFIAHSPNSVPALSSVALKNCQGYGAIGGSGWSGGPASHTTIDGEKVSFNERDNRGSIYLYFTPQDQVVGLSNVQGIGWRGVDDSVDGQAVRTLLPIQFHQRIFTLRKRNGEKEAIGKHLPPYVYPLILEGEATWEDSGLGLMDRSGRGTLKPGMRVLLTAPLLPVPTEADFATDGVVTAPGVESDSGLYQIMDNLDPIDALIGLSNDKSLLIKKAWNPKDPKYARQETLEEAVAFKYGRDPVSVKKARDDLYEMSQRAHVFTSRALGNGQVLITRGETPYEAGLRLQGDEFREAQSFHSGIPNNPQHSRRVLAYDVAIGAGESVDDVTFYAYLCRVADWRLDWKRTRASANSQFDTELDLPDEDVEKLYRQEESKSRDLIDSTVAYRTSGALPDIVGKTKMPSLVASQTWSEYQRGKPVRSGGEV
ncbi:T6SS effector phospholipase Tle3 domain-containing protein [Pseudomonas sp. Fl4BN1]|uniref:T6SS effector phospholipase Tle3 domain-containing protein n=1 Tax=Pseudomonas sp. Fl4BN1 TaxID=2697651 RepID=UPI001377FF45|nr:DUF3274 domain-containing protein [Pseudomonas sp. Fl4BN1]NBF08075.1 DUF3274 domain-containing protein [Pseudomonas sp. Fl4BN1]